MSDSYLQIELAAQSAGPQCPSSLAAGLGLGFSVSRSCRRGIWTSIPVHYHKPNPKPLTPPLPPCLGRGEATSAGLASAAWGVLARPSSPSALVTFPAAPDTAAPGCSSAGRATARGWGLGVGQMLGLGVGGLGFRVRLRCEGQEEYRRTTGTQGSPAPKEHRSDRPA